jgi:type IV secretory pathway protease TraF
MPGSARCARCGASLALATAAVDVHPPRAGRLSRHMPRLWGLKRAWSNLYQSAGRPFSVITQRFEDTDFDLSTMVRLIVPGWAHWHRGNWERGLIFFVAFFSLLLPAIVLLGTGWGSLLLGLAFGMHVAASVDAMVGRFADFGDRLGFTLVCALALLAVIYLPAGFLISRVATPIQITQWISGFSRGDVLWYNRSAVIEPGDLVCYRVPQTTVHGRLPDGHAVNYVFENLWVNRVVAVAGQTLTRRDGQLLVDGQASPWQGPVELDIDGERSFEVPAGHVLIPPGGLVPEGAGLNAGAWRRLSLVPRSEVLGRVYFRSLPIWRMSPID